jgi:hypothetical protein
LTVLERCRRQPVEAEVESVMFASRRPEKELGTQVVKNFRRATRRTFRRVRIDYYLPGDPEAQIGIDWFDGISPTLREPLQISMRLLISH